MVLKIDELNETLFNKNQAFVFNVNFKEKFQRNNFLFDVEFKLWKMGCENIRPAKAP